MKTHFLCAKVELSFVMDRLQTFDQVELACTISDEILRFSDVMMKRLRAGQKDDKLYVQPEIRNHFWKNTMNCLRFCDRVYLVNERDSMTKKNVS